MQTPFGQNFRNFPITLVNVIFVAIAIGFACGRPIAILYGIFIAYAAIVAIPKLRGPGLIYGIVITFAIFAALPFFWMVIAMFKASPDLYNTDNMPFVYNDIDPRDSMNRNFSDEVSTSFVDAGMILRESEDPDLKLVGDYFRATSLAGGVNRLEIFSENLGAGRIDPEAQLLMAGHFEDAAEALTTADAEAAVHFGKAAEALRRGDGEGAQRELDGAVATLRENFGFRNPTLDKVKYLFNETPYMTFVLNSVFIGLFVVLVTLIFAVPAAYSLARLAGRWGERVGIGMFLVYLVPPTLLFIPMTWIVAQLGLQNSRWSLILVYPTFTIPFGTWLLSGFMKSIPKDIEEQAMIDGYSRFGAMIRVVLPLAVPGILTIVVFAFMLSLHEFIYALAFIQSSADKPVSIGVPTELYRGDVFFWQELMGAAVLVAIPVAIIYNFFLDRFIAGLTMGAVKG